VTVKAAAQERLATQSISLDNLDELGEIMSDMLQKQQDVEVIFHTIYCGQYLID
jgi:autophagy-related protein 17